MHYLGLPSCLTLQMREAKYLSIVNREIFQRPVNELYGRTDIEGSASSQPIFNPRLCTKMPTEGKDASLHAKKRFGKVYKSDEMTLLNDPMGEKRDSKSSAFGQMFDYRVSSDPRWSSSSSSARFSQSEGSVDFGSESQATWSGEFEDVNVVADKKSNSNRLSSPSFAGSDNARFSFASFGSFETNKDDVFVDSLTEDNDGSVVTNTNLQSSSSGDESDTGTTSKIRISAATVYEHAVIENLEDPLSDKKKLSSSRIKSADFDYVFESNESVRKSDYRKSAPIETELEKNSDTLSQDELLGEQKESELVVEERKTEPVSSDPVSSEPEQSPKLKNEKTSKHDFIITTDYSEDKPLTGSPIIRHLERHLSIDSSVSTLSEAETVINMTESSSLTKQPRDASVKKVSSFNEERKKRPDSLTKSVSSEGIDQSTTRASSESPKCKDYEGLKETVTKDQNLSHPSKYEVIKKRKGKTKGISHHESHKKTKYVEEEKLQKQSSKRSLSSISSGSVEEQEISLDISDTNQSDSSSMSKKEMSKQSSKKHSSLPEIKDRQAKYQFCEVDISPENQEDCFVIGNRYAMMLEKKNSEKERKKQAKSSRKLSTDSQKSKKEEYELKTESKTPLGEKPSMEPDLIDRGDARFSTGSLCTDVVEGELVFSETEGEEVPNDDTSDDDLNLEDEVLRALAEVRFKTFITKETPYAVLQLEFFSQISILKLPLLS